MTTPIQNSTSTIPTSSSTASTATSNANSAASMQTQFLTMLTAQLKNQDPTSPMDNAAITTQMAQLSTVSGIGQLNTTLQALTNSMQTASAASLIGQNVLVPGSSLSLSGSQATGGVTLAGPAASLKVTIQDTSGNVVQTLQLGAQTGAGIVPFSWNGSTSSGTTAPDGSYTFSAQAVSPGTASNPGAASTPATLSYGTVKSITPGAAGATVGVAGLGGFAMTAIQQVL